MPKKCLLCKTETNSICNHNFHTFSKNELLSKIWIDSVKLSNAPNYNNAYVCTDHYDKKLFYPSDEFRIKKLLFPKTIPKNKNFDSYNLSTEKDVNLELNIYKNSEICTDNESLKNSFDEISDDSNFEAVNEEDLFNDLKINNAPNTYSNHIKKEQSFRNIKSTKKVHFINGYKTEYISPKDFVSNEAWYRFLRFINYKNSKLAAARNKNSHVQKKIKICLKLVENLLTKEEDDNINYDTFNI